MKKRVKKPMGATIELIGGIFYVDRYADGTEHREEICGKAVLDLIVRALEEYLKTKL